MAETILETTTEIPKDYQNIFSEKLDELKNINQHLAQNREEIDWLKSETAKTLHNIKEQIKEF